MLGYLYVVRSPLRGVLLAPLTLGLVVLSVVLAGAYVYGTRTDSRYVPLAASAGLVSGLVAVVARLLYPTIDPGSGLSVEAAVVSVLPLNLMTVMMALFLPLVLAYFAVLYRTFSGPVEAGEGY
jgi:cytochrome d ubiquinol oxidase subunit II